MISRFLWGAILLASPVAAQITTDCNVMGLYTTCQTYGVPQPPNAADAMIQNMLKPQPGPSIPDIIAANRARKAEQMAIAQQRARQQEEIDLRRLAGQLVAAGNCVGARDLVLNAGDFEAAKAVDDVCQAKTDDQTKLPAKH